MNNWLVLWKTWLEAEIETPWDFTLVEYANEYKNRSNPESGKVPAEVVDAIWMSFNPEKTQQFIDQHVDAVLLSAVIGADEENSALEEVKQYFYDAEFVQCAAIPDELLLDAVNIIRKE